MKWLNNFYRKKVYIDILSDIKNHQEKYVGQNYPPSMLVIPGKFEREHGYSKKQIEETIRHLCNAGYLKQSENSSNIFITEEGKQLLKDYFQFLVKGTLAKLTQVFNQNFTSIISILALLISITALIKK